MKTLNLTLTEKELEIILNALDNYHDDKLEKDMDIKNNLFENLDLKLFLLKNP